MRTDSTTLFKQARLEMKAAGAYFEAAKSAQRLCTEIIERRDLTYLEALALGVPAAIASHVADNTTKEADKVYEEGLLNCELANYHREMGEALLVQYDKALTKELRRSMRSATAWRSHD